MFHSFKSLKAWQKIILSLTAAAAAVGVYFAYALATTPKTQALAANTKLVTVEYGNISNTISATGSLAFSNTASLTFGAESTVSTVGVSTGDSVKKGQVLATLNTTSLQAAVTAAQVNLATAESNLEDAQNPYTATDIKKANLAVTQAELSLQSAQQALQDALNPDPTTIAARQNAVDAAQANLIKAQNDLVTLQAGPTPAELAKANVAVEQAAAAVMQAQANLAAALQGTDTTAIALAQANLDLQLANLEAAQDALAALVAGPTAAELAAAQLAINQAQVALDQAKASLAELQNPDPLTIAQLEAAVDSATLALQQAEDNAATVQAGADANNVTAKQLQYDSAKAALDNAKAQLANATLTAPFNGIVSAVNIIVGQTVSATTDVIDMVDTSTVEMDATADEIDVPSIKVGQSVTLSVDAYPDAVIEGVVATLSLIGKSSSGIVSYPLIVRVTTIPDGVELREGMSATGTIIVEQANHVLVIPTSAIGGTEANPTVTVMVNGQTEVRSVTLGITDGTYTQVLSGLAQGDQVVVQTSTSSSSSSASSSSSSNVFGDLSGGSIGGGGSPPAGMP